MGANLSKREAQLQAMAAAEQERREAAAHRSAPPPKPKKTPEPRPSSASSKGDLLPASSFRRQKPGYAYSKGPSGTGYYRDAVDPPGSSSGKAQQPSESPSQPPPRGVCTVVKIHPDGFVDLQLSSGEIVERVEQSWLERLGRA